MLDAFRRDDVGLVIIDTAPHALEQAAAAATAADLVIIPTRAGVMDIEAIDATVDIVNGVNAEGVIVINATRPRGTMTAEARQAPEIYELPICPTAIVQRAALSSRPLSRSACFRQCCRVSPSDPPFDPSPDGLDLGRRLTLGVKLLHAAPVDQGIGQRRPLHDRCRADRQLVDRERLARRS